MMSRDNNRKTELKQALKTRRPGSQRVGLLMTLWLSFVWFAVFESYSWLNLVVAVLVAIVVQLVFPLPHRSGIWHVRLGPMFHLVFRFMWDLVRAGFHVTVLVLKGGPREDAIIRCPIRSCTPEYVTILVAMTSLIPGTIVLQTDRNREVMYLHCLDINGQGGIEGVRAATSAQEARILRAVAPNQILEEAGLNG